MYGFWGMTLNFAGTLFTGMELGVVVLCVDFLWVYLE